MSITQRIIKSLSTEKYLEPAFIQKWSTLLASHWCEQEHNVNLQHDYRFLVNRRKIVLTSWINTQKAIDYLANIEPTELSSDLFLPQQYITNDNAQQFIWYNDKIAKPNIGYPNCFTNFQSPTKGD